MNTPQFKEMMSKMNKIIKLMEKKWVQLKVLEG